MNKTVFVGLSGGVDSSVAALRLKQAGYDVVGVFIKVWHPDWMVCNWEQERLDAMRVAAHLEIPFLTCDAEEAYKQEVAEYFIGEYKAGRTPNPDVMCNKAVKFGAFLRFAKQKGADFIATGHYAQRKTTEQGIELHRGVDLSKDQSYFLWTLTNEQLQHVLLPVGDTEKSKIREEAAAASIPTASKKDSQGICFLGHVDIPEFLSHYIELRSGPVLNTQGEVIGEHQGAFVYTLGQRHGFSVTNHTDSQTPHYVISRDIEHNSITIASEPAQQPAARELTLSDVLLRTPLEVGDEIEFQTRYRQTPQIATVAKQAEQTLTLTPQAARAQTAAGQSCVLYRGSHCLGGGIIG